MKIIKNLRQRAGLTQEELAMKMQITQQAVARWENENTTPSVDKLPLLAKLLGCTIDELYKEV
jgi:transcriptional regulator with XRE-family HTH domain